MNAFDFNDHTNKIKNNCKQRLMTLLGKLFQ